MLLLSTNDTTSLSKGRLFLHLSFLFNVVEGVYRLPHNAPIELREHHHFSRSHSLTLKVPYAKTNAFYYSFFCDTLRYWNTLPQDIIDSSDSEHFKSKLSFTSETCINSYLKIVFLTIPSIILLTLNATPHM